MKTGTKNRATELIEENEKMKCDISNDPMAIYGGVVSEFREDYDGALRGKLSKLLDDPTCTVEEGETAMEYLGCMAQDAFERKVYGN